MEQYTPTIDKEELAPGLVVYRNVIPGYEQLIPYIEQVVMSGGAGWDTTEISGNQVDTMYFQYPSEFKDPNDFSVSFAERIALVSAGFLGFAEKDYIDSNSLPQNLHDQIGLLRYSKGTFFPLSSSEDSKAVIVMYFLNDDYSGSALEFPNLDVTYQPKANEALILPSADGYQYSISELTDGTKYSIITYIRMGR